MSEAAETARLMALAERARTVAAGMKDGGTKRQMLEIAAANERLAKEAATLADATKRLLENDK